MSDSRQNINKMKTVKALFTAGCVLPALALAEGVQGNGLTYDYVGIGYTHLAVDTTYRASFHGMALEGSKLINENFFVQGTYFDTSADKVHFLGRDLDINVDFKQYQFSAGYRHPLQPGTDLIATVGYIQGSTRVAKGQSVSDKAYPISLGVKSKLKEDIEGSAEGLIVEGDLGLLLNLQYKISDIYAIGGYYRHDKNSDLYALTVRFLC